LIAEELVRTLIGSIGLVASVPLTTFLASIVVTHQRPATNALTSPEEAIAVAGARRAVAKTAAGLAHAPARVGTTVAQSRQHRRKAKAERTAAKAADWETPAAEREFWSDDR